jgi:lysozyme
MTIRARGCDVSFWNGAVNFAKMKTAGASFVYAKASQLQADSMFTAYWPAARNAGLLRGAYHFLDWHTSELDQAALFCNLLKADPGELPPMLDLELDPAKFGLTASLVQGKVWNFLTVVEKALGRVPGIYCGYYYWLQWMTNNSAWSKYPLWLPWYASESIVKSPPPWTGWKFWQDTGNGNGPMYGSTGLSMDMNWYNGTEDDLRKFAVNVPPVVLTCPNCGKPMPAGWSYTKP